MDVSRSDIEEGNVLMLNNSIKAEVKRVNDGYIEVYISNDEVLELAATVYYDGNGIIVPGNSNDINTKEHMMFFESANDMAVIFEFLGLLESLLS